MLTSAWRSLRNAPLVSTIAIVSLALGIGANTAMFSIADALLLRALPVSNAERLALVAEVDGRAYWTNPIWENIRDRSGAFDGAFAVGRTRFNAAPRGVVDPVDGLYVSAHYFDALGVTAARGRTFLADDDRRGGGADGPVAVISHAFWQSRFGGREDVVGQPLTLDGVSFTVVGITPRSFFGHEVGRAFDVAVPLGAEPLVNGAQSMLDRRSTWWLNIFVVAHPGQSLQQATALLRAMQPVVREAAMPPDWSADMLSRFLTRPLEARPAAGGTSDLRGRYEQAVYALMAVVALTLLIACGNIANVMLARTAARRGEFAMRAALGASRWRLASQLLRENLLLGAGGTALGVIVALWSSRLIVRELSAGDGRIMLAVGLDWRMFAFTALVGVGTTLLFGLAPALRATGVAPMEALRSQRATSSTSGAFMGMSGTLVVAQVSLSLVLLVSAGLFVRSFLALSSVDPGFVPEQVLTATISTDASEADAAERIALFERLQGGARSVPGVRETGYSVMVPVSGGSWNFEIEIPGRSDIPAGERIVDVNLLSPGWFDALAIPVLAGRDFTAADRAERSHTAVVNRAFAERYFGGANPVGQTVVQAAFASREAIPMEIVGLVGNAVYTDLRVAPEPTLYLAMAQYATPPSSAVLSVRAETTDLPALERALAASFSEVDRDVSVSFRPLASFVDASLTQERLLAKLAGLFGVLALVLATVGLYGITAYAVAQRRVELGIRMALGASPRSVVRLVLTRAGALVAGGVVAGVLASWWASQFVGALLFGLAPTDPATLLGASLLLVAVSLLASWIPARNAARVDPAIVMRDG